MCVIINKIREYFHWICWKLFRISKLNNFSFTLALKIKKQIFIAWINFCFYESFFKEKKICFFNIFNFHCIKSFQTFWNVCKDTTWNISIFFKEDDKSYKKLLFSIKNCCKKCVFFFLLSGYTHKDGVPVFQITELCAIQNRSGIDHSPNSPNMFDLFGIIQNLNSVQFFYLENTPKHMFGVFRFGMFGVFGSVQDFLKVIKSIMECPKHCLQAAICIFVILFSKLICAKCRQLFKTFNSQKKSAPCTCTCAWESQFYMM